MKGQRQDFVAVTLYSGASNTETRIAMDFFCGGVDLPFYMWCTTQVELWKKRRRRGEREELFLCRRTRDVNCWLALCLR